MSRSIGKFTNYERGLLSYGTQSQRLGKDSIKRFDQCSICLNDSIQPVACFKGHLYCTECIYSNLLKQKKENEIKLKEWELNQTKNKQELESEQQKSLNEKIKEFEDNNVNILSSLESNKTTTTTTTTTTNSNSINYDKEKKHESFWISPNNYSTENNQDNNINNKEQDNNNKPILRTYCVHGHPLKVSQLKKISFSTSTENKDDKDNLKPICKICNKYLTNSTKIKVLKKCGHVFCAPCLQELSIGKEKKKIDQNSNQCYICEKVYDPYVDVIHLQMGSTGYAATNTVTAKKYTSPTAVI